MVGSLANLGEPQHPELARELERRISTIRDVRSDIDARLFDTPEKIERGWLTLRTAQRLYSAFDPSRASN